MKVGYVRVSTGKAEQDTSVEGQIAQMRERGCAKVIVDRKSAFNPNVRRPGWEELLGLVASGRVTTVVAVSLSRLSRQGEDQIFLRMCQRKGVQVELIDGTPADVSDPAGKLLTGVMSTVNEVDSMIKGINVRNGLKRRKEAGAYANGRMPFGYKYDGHNVVPHPTNFKQARKLWDQLAEHEFMVQRTIRRCQLHWTVPGLSNWIHHPFLRGIVRHEAGKVQALITWEEYQQACRLIEQRRVCHVRGPSTVHVFTGLIKCQSCGKRLNYSKHRNLYRIRCMNNVCPWFSRGILERNVRQQMVDALHGAVDQMATVAATAKASGIDTGRLEKQQQLDQLLALQGQGVPGLDSAIDALRVDLLIPDTVPAGANWHAFRAVLAEPGVLAAASDEELRAIVLELVDEIVYLGNPAEVEIRLRDGSGNDATECETSIHG